MDLANGPSNADDAWLECLVHGCRRVRRGESVFTAGEAFRSLYSIRSGFFKTHVVDGEGRQQVIGFFMPGDLLGLDGMGLGSYHVTAAALEDSLVAVMPYARIQKLSREDPAVQRELHMALSREVVREQEMMMLLGSIRAEGRLAAFLLGLSPRLGLADSSQCAFQLPMTREDIASYLGMTLETVSRLLSRFQGQGLLAIRRRQVRLLDAGRLRALVELPSP